MRRIFFGVGLAIAFLGMVGRTEAALVMEVEPNNTFATAQFIADLSFTLEADPNIGDKAGNDTSTTLPHATVKGTGNNTFDFYSFNVPKPTLLILDIDNAMFVGPGPQVVAVDHELFLFASDGTLLATNDQAPIAWGRAGSTSVNDPFIEYQVNNPGTYYVAVASYNSLGVHAGVLGPGVKPGEVYDLNISRAPEPSTMVLGAMGVALLVASRLRRRVK